MATAREIRVERSSRNKLGSRERNFETEFDAAVSLSGAGPSARIRCHWINRLDQFNTVSMTLVVRHVGRVIPEQRIDKNFRVVNGNYDSVNADFLSAEAAKEVDRIAIGWNAGEIPRIAGR